MLPKRSRLPKALFDGKGYGTVRTPYFLLKVRANGEKNDRIGIVAGTAVHKRAVKRNFWKRQAKAEFALHASGKQNLSRRDIILILSSKVNTLTKKQFREKLAAAFRTVSR